MRLSYVRWAFFLLVLGVHFNLLANTPPSLPSIPPQVRQKITQNFTKSLPSLTIDHIEATPIPHLYQVISGPVVIYVTEDAQYAISGDILNLQDGKTNITDKTRQAALIQALNKLGEATMIIYAPPATVKPLHTVTVFTDVECTYCQKLHTQIDKMNKLGITVRYIAFPKEGRNTPGYDKLVSVWCARDRKNALNKAMTGSIQPLKCHDHPVDKQFHLGALAGVNGTPTFVIDGKLMPGYADAETLLEILTQEKKGI